MKHYLITAAAAVFLSACAGTKVTNSVIAAGASAPKAIYIRPFNIPDGAFQGSYESEALRKIRESQAPATFAGILKEELEKIAPTAVIGDNEEAESGWLVTGDIDLVKSGNAAARATVGNVGAGRSGILVHVRVTEVGSKHQSDSKGGRGPVVYEFDVAGGSRLMGVFGTQKNSGIGYAPPFEMRNAVAKIRETLELDTHRYGLRE